MPTVMSSFDLEVPIEPIAVEAVQEVQVAVNDEFVTHEETIQVDTEVMLPPPPMEVDTQVKITEEQLPPPLPSNDAESEPPIPSSPRQIRTKELLLQFPGLTIPEALRAAKYTLEESETPSLISLIEQQTAASKKEKEKRTRLPPGSQMPHPTKRSAPTLNDIDPSRLPPNITLCTIRPKNAAGRCLCRVQGCRKLDQANNDGFCRAHYNLIKGDEEEDPQEAWTCDTCNSLVASNQSRCGTCHRWKDGVRSGTQGVKKPPAQSLVYYGQFWTCPCGYQVAEPKTRCGKCHHWKGGKRTGGWKLGAKAKEDDADDIDRTQDWTCCDTVIPAAKTRCGKCRKWRGGKRQNRWSYAGTVSDAGQVIVEVDNERVAVDQSVDWTCKEEACKTVNKGCKKRCSACFSWRFSRKKARVSTGSVGVKVEGGGAPMTMDQLDALVTKELEKHGKGVVGENGEGGEATNVEAPNAAPAAVTETAVKMEASNVVSVAVTETTTGMEVPNIAPVVVAGTTTGMEVSNVAPAAVTETTTEPVAGFEMDEDALAPDANATAVMADAGHIKQEDNVMVEVNHDALAEETRYEV